MGDRKRKWKGKGGKGAKGAKGASKGLGKGGKSGKRPKTSESEKAGSFKRHKVGPMPLRAVLVTSRTPSQTQKATREAIRLLQGILENGEETAEPELLASAARSVGESLEEELQALREDVKPKTRPLRFYTEVSRGVTIISVDGHTPSQLVVDLFERQRAAGREGQAVRFVVRMAPLDVVCSPHLKNFQAAAAAELPKLLKDAREGAGWYCSFHSRAMSTIKREDVMAALKDIMKPLKLDLSVSDAEYMVVIEVNPVLCGFAVLRDYEGGLFECHLQKASEEFENCAEAGFDEIESSESDGQEESADPNTSPKEDGHPDTGPAEG